MARQINSPWARNLSDHRGVCRHDAAWSAVFPFDLVVARESAVGSGDVHRRFGHRHRSWEWRIEACPVVEFVPDESSVSGGSSFSAEDGAPGW